jgi:hypothetical protein
VNPRAMWRQPVPRLADHPFRSTTLVERAATPHGHHL